MDRLKWFGMAAMVVATLVVPQASQARDSDAMEFTKDSLDVVMRNVAEGKAVLVDVREIIEWNAGHVQKAIFLPWRELQSKARDPNHFAKLPKDKILYTYCAVGYRSSRAAKIIAGHQYQVRPLKAGYEELAKAGFEVEKK